VKMNTSIAQPAATALAAIQNLRGGLQNVQTQVRVPGGEPIMRLGGDGIWVYGADNVEVQEGSEWALNPLSLRYGFVCWKIIPQGTKDTPELYGEELVPINLPLPDKSQLQAYNSENQAVDHAKHPWVQVISVDIKCLTGDDTGEQTVYKPSSTGGIRALQDLIKRLDEQLNKDPAHPVPVCLLESDSYQHKTWGKTYIPILKIVRWAALDDSDDTAAAEQAPQASGGRTRRAPVQQERETQTVTQDDVGDVTQVLGKGTAEAPVGERKRRRRAA
jgi:hypothetical protein